MATYILFREWQVKTPSPPRQQDSPAVPGRKQNIPLPAGPDKFSKNPGKLAEQMAADTEKKSLINRFVGVYQWTLRVAAKV